MFSLNAKKVTLGGLCSVLQYKNNVFERFLHTKGHFFALYFFFKTKFFTQTFLVKYYAPYTPCTNLRASIYQFPSGISWRAVHG